MRPTQAALSKRRAKRQQQPQQAAAAGRPGASAAAAAAAARAQSLEELLAGMRGRLAELEGRLLVAGPGAAG
jgi:hypothetical protein